MDTFVTVPLEERFVLYKCDALRPVLVSDHLSGTRIRGHGNTRNNNTKRSSSGSGSGSGIDGNKKGTGEKMYRAISDSSLGITVATHAYKGRWGASHVSLYKRQKCVDVVDIMMLLKNKSGSSVSSGRKSSGSRKSRKSKSAWGIVDVVHLGRSKFDVSAELKAETETARETETETDDLDDNDYDNDNSAKKMENCMVLAMVCAKNSFGAADGVTLVGESDDDYDSDDSDSDSDSEASGSAPDSNSDSDSDESMNDNDDDNDQDQECSGEIIILIASRRKITIQKRIPLTSASVPQFTPTIAMHPQTYLNKIVIGGVNGDLILVNIRSGKVIHRFQCLGPGNDDDDDDNHDKHKHKMEDRITAMESSPAVDTIAIGTASGMVHLVNIRMDVVLFSLTHDAHRSSLRGTKKIMDKAGITSLSFRTDANALEQGIAPLAVGQRNGTISIWDLTPRSNDDSDDDEYTMYNSRSISISASKSAKDCQRTLLCQMEHAHRGGVSHLEYLPQEPLLLSSGVKSNSLIMHIFDNPNHTGRILRQRVGHVAPPGVIRYQHSSNGGVLASMADGTDAASCQILSGGGKGDNTLRVFSTARSVLDREYGQGKGLVGKARALGLEKADLLLKPIIGLVNCETKTRDWGDLVTIHKDHAMAYVWSTKQKSQSGPVLRQDEWNVSAMKVQPPKSAHATAVAISSCGNFALVGSRGGIIYKYNMQSGLPRGSFPKDATDSTKSKKDTKIAGNINRTTRLLERTLKVHKLHHEEEKDMSVLTAEAKRRNKLQLARHVDSEVTGLAVDALNKTLVSVGSDAKLILWSFATHAPHRKSPVRLSCPATKLVLARDSNLLAIALEDYCVNLFDCSTFSVVRRFGMSNSICRHTGPISDVAFGPDGRNLYTSSFDGTVRVWDVPTNTCVDWMTFASAPTALSLSTTGEFLATAHQGKLGISLWCDRSFFQTVHLDGANPPSKPYQMDEPAAVAEDEDVDALAKRALEDNAKMSSLGANGGKSGNEEDLGEEKTIVPKKVGLITLSGLPAAHWKNLFNLELVKERNKPSEAPKKPPSAPFFLQWRDGDNLPPPNVSDSKEANGENGKKEEEEWDAAWSDEDGEDTVKQSTEELSDGKRKSDEELTQAKSLSKILAGPKKQKISHFRSDLARLLEQCSESMNFESISDHFAKMGPSAIDVAFSSLCHGMHDLEEGLRLLHLCSMWLLQSCKSRRNYEVFNAYLHRFLYIHATTIAGIDASTNDGNTNTITQSETQNNDDGLIRVELLESIRELKISQKSATGNLRNKMQETLCLLRHFSRMV